MKHSYVVKFETDQGESEIEFTSITKALGFISLMVKRGCACKILQK
jgi:hypothetical protein